MQNGLSFQKKNAKNHQKWPESSQNGKKYIIGSYEPK